MIDGNVLAQARRKAKFQGAERTSHNLYANFNHSVGLGFVSSKALDLYVARRLPFLENRGCTMFERYGCSLIIRLGNGFRVAEPLDVGNNQISAIVVLIIAFLKHYMREDVLVLKASYQQTLENVSGGPSSGDGFVALATQFLGHFFSATHTFLGDVGVPRPTIGTDDWVVVVVCGRPTPRPITHCLHHGLQG